MSEPDIQLVLTAITDLRDANNATHDAIRETLTSGIHGLQLKMEVDNSLINRSLEDLAKDLKYNRDRIKKFEDSQEKISQKMVRFDRHVAVMTTIKKRWILLTIGLLLFFTSFNFLYHAGWIQKILNFLISKI